MSVAGGVSENRSSVNLDHTHVGYRHQIIPVADAAIGCWDAKYEYHFWRPITAIRDTVDDGNPLTVSDATWTPLFATPGQSGIPVRPLVRQRSRRSRARP